MKPLYIVGTARHVGKTTLTLGLLDAFRLRGLKVAYLKPLGQHFKTGQKNLLHDDARVVARFLGSRDGDMVDMAVPLPRGRVEQELYDPRTQELLDKIAGNCDKLSAENDLVVIEAMGNVAMGSCMSLSAADVARHLGARALLVVGAGIGRTIDEVAICQAFLAARGAELIGAVVNKAWLEKYARIDKSVTLGLERMGVHNYGTLPFQQELASPTMAQLHSRLGGELLGGAEHLHHRVGRTIIGAMAAEHMVNYVQPNTLVITPGDRSDAIGAALDAHAAAEQENMDVAGMVLTGGFQPEPEVLRRIGESHLPVISVERDTYTVASAFHNTVFKITPDDRERIGWALCLVAEHVDVGGIIDALA